MKNLIISTSFRREALTNFHIIDGIFRAAAGEFGERRVSFCFIDEIYSRISEDCNLLVVGSSLRDGVDYRSITSLVKNHGGRSFFWLTDDPYEFTANVRVLSFFDFIFTNDSESFNYYFGQGAPVAHLPLAADVANDYREFNESPEYQVFFCGYPYSNRKLVIKELHKVLVDLDLKLTLCPKGWDLPSDAAVSYVNVRDHAQLIDFYNSSSVVLNIGRTYNLANKNGIHATTPGPRTFEAALSAASQAYIAPSFEMSEYFSDDEIGMFDNVVEMGRFCELMVRDSAARKRYALAAQARALRDHTYIKRLKHVDSVVNLFS